MRRVLWVSAAELARVERLNDLRTTQLDAVMLDLLGSTEEMHDWHAGEPGAFRRTVAGVRRARALGLTLVARCFVTRSNYRHLTELVRVAHTLGMRAMCFEARAAGGSPPPAHELLAPHLNRAVDQARALGLAVVAGGRAFPDEASEWFVGVEPDEKPV